VTHMSANAQCLMLRLRIRFELCLMSTAACAGKRCVGESVKDCRVQTVVTATVRPTLSTVYIYTRPNETKCEHTVHVVM
jgi:hypothetical protein